MTTDVKTITGSHSPDYNQAMLVNWSPPAGEEWIWGSTSIYWSTNGDGTEDTYATAGLWPSAYSMDQYTDPIYVNYFNMWDNSNKAAVTTPNAYFDDSMAVVLRAENGSSGTYKYRVNLRRVI